MHACSKVCLLCGVQCQEAASSCARYQAAVRHVRSAVQMVLPVALPPRHGVSAVGACRLTHSWSLVTVGYLLPMLLLGANEEANRCAFLEFLGPAWRQERARFSILCRPSGVLRLCALCVWALVVVPMVWHLLEAGMLLLCQLPGSEAHCAIVAPPR